MYYNKGYEHINAMDAESIPIVHSRVHRRHPELSDDDVRHAWWNSISTIARPDTTPRQYVSIGVDSSGRVVEMVAIRGKDGKWLIYHAMTPPSKKTLRETALS
ncbi:hypothetical protein ACFQY8_01060 [Alloscardovia venturai]|uniref:Toxin n=1 Tax=Alloscardovia venturai TaxID=1769421 RepID=A0ABW2Y3J0_9BIFI